MRDDLGKYRFFIQLLLYPIEHVCIFLRIVRRKWLGGEMLDTKPFITNLIVNFFWSRGRLFELWSGNLAPASSGLDVLDATMAMAAVRQNMRTMTLMINFGANPAIKDFLAYRMAACAGDIAAMTLIESLAAPTEYALDDALLWAQSKKRIEAIAHIAQLRSRTANKK